MKMISKRNIHSLHIGLKVFITSFGPDRGEANENICWDLGKVDHNPWLDGLSVSFSVISGNDSRGFAKWPPKAGLTATRPVFQGNKL